MQSGFILTLTIFLPIIASAIVLFISEKKILTIKMITFGGALATFITSIILFLGFNNEQIGFQFLQKYVWIESVNINYFVGIDGLSLLLILLSSFLTLVALLCTWNHIEKNLKNYSIMILFLETGIIGVFASLDLFLFYFFWEAMLIPMYFIVGLWGGENRIYATTKFFIFTLLGSVLMLVAIIFIAYYSSILPNGKFTTDIIELYKIAPLIPQNIQTCLFIAFALAFAVKIPMLPLHTWLPDAHVEAPTLGSVLLAGVLLKMGAYGFIRFNLSLFVDVSIKAMPYMIIISIAAIIYGAVVAFVQTDIKKLIAYSSISHMGFITLGIFSFTEEGMQGAIIQMINHGLSTGALFLLVGIIYDKTHTRLISNFGGLAKPMPIYSTLFMIIMLSSIGLPGLNGFVGEVLILVGIFKSQIHYARYYSAFAGLGIILSAIYMLWMYQRVMFGPSKKENIYNGRIIFDINKRELIALISIIIFIVWIGIYPKSFLKVTSPMVQNYFENIGNIIK